MRRLAAETRHQTATQAADVAHRAQVELLALTHLSNRYFGPEIAREARAVFPGTVVPRDFDVVEVPLPERGAPHLVKGGAVRGQALHVHHPRRNEVQRRPGRLVAGLQSRSAR